MLLGTGRSDQHPKEPPCLPERFTSRKVLRGRNDRIFRKCRRQIRFSIIHPLGRVEEEKRCRSSGNRAKPNSQERWRRWCQKIWSVGLSLVTQFLFYFCNTCWYRHQVEGHPQASTILSYQHLSSSIFARRNYQVSQEVQDQTCFQRKSRLPALAAEMILVRHLVTRG